MKAYDHGHPENDWQSVSKRVLLLDGTQLQW